MIHEASQHVGERKNNFGDINFLDEVLIINDRAGGDDYCLLYHQPGSQPREKKNGVVIHLKFDDPRKNNRQDEKEKKRI